MFELRSEKRIRMERSSGGLWLEMDGKVGVSRAEKVLKACPTDFHHTIVHYETILVASAIASDACVGRSGANAFEQLWLYNHGSYPSSAEGVKGLRKKVGVVSFHCKR